MKISIFDTTLRDGAQSEGISFSIEDKLKICMALDNFGVDFIEAGNPFSNLKDTEFFKKASELSLKKSKLVAFGSTRYKNKDVENDEGVKILLNTPVEYICIFGKSSDYHVTEVLGTTLEENLEMISSTVSYLTKKGKKIIFDAEHFFDGYKNNSEYALKTLLTAQNAGAVYITLCDTNGGSFPHEIEKIVNEIKAKISVPLGIHAHNDTGCAVANTLYAVNSGITLVQGTFTGIGERCGNADLATIIPNLQLKLNYKCVSDEKIKNITRTARYICEISNCSLPKSHPYVGKTAFAHKGGMHVDGVMKNQASFEHIEPEKVGNHRAFLLSEMSGKKAIIEKINALAPFVANDEKKISEILRLLKKREFDGYFYEAAQASFEIFVLKYLGIFKEFFKIEHFKIISEENSFNHSFFKNASAIIKIAVGEKTTMTAAEGDGPVNALDAALRKALSEFYPDAVNSILLTDYKVRVINTGEGTASVVRVLIESSDENDSWVTVGASSDVVAASLKALVDSIEYKMYILSKNSK